MDGVPCSWSTAGTTESFSRSRPDKADTLSKLAKLVARAEPHRQHTLNQSDLHRPQPPLVNPCVCSECDHGFPDTRELLLHQEIKHALPKPHQCLSCGKEFLLLSSLQLHKCPHESFACKLCLGQPRLGVPCPACMAGTSETTSHQDKSPHRQPHLHDSSPYACAPCGRGFSQKQALLYHQQAGCSEPSSPVLDISCPPADSPPSLSEPGSPPADSPPSLSEPGSPPADSPPSLSEPGSPPCSDSSDARPGPSTGGAYHCQICSRSFRRAVGFAVHQSSMHRQEFLVNRAARVAAQAGKKKTKQRSNSTEGAYHCQICSRTFSRPAGLAVHQKSMHRTEFLAIRAARMAAQAAKKTKLSRQLAMPRLRVVGTPPDRPLGSQPGRSIDRPADRRKKSKKKLLSCRSCDMVFKNTAKLYLHRKEQHSREKTVCKDPRPVIPKRRKGETYPCQVCGRVFLHHLSFMNHCKKHGPSVVTVTPEQNSTKDSKLPEKKPKKVQNGLRSSNTVGAGSGSHGMKRARLEEQFNHSGRPRKVPEVEEEVDGEFPCPSCAEVFSCQSGLKDHVELHQSSVRRRQCSVCTQDMAFSKGPGSRRRRLYHCLPCQQAFTALDTFLEHCQDHLRLKVEEDSITEAYYGNKN